MARIEERRAQLVAQIPRWYSGGLNFVGINLTALAAVAGFLALLREPRWWHAALAPGFFAFANLFEWWIHKGPLHHRWPLLGVLYARHARAHHVVFTHERMAIAGGRELYLVLFPAYVLPLVLLMNAPLAGGLYLLDPDLCWTFLATALAYYLVYEWLHLCHHLPPESRVGRRALVRRLRTHHWRHHDPARMTAGNFNVSFPFADWVLRSTLPAEEGETGVALQEAPGARGRG